ncbi:MAG: tyrosine-type recombinase/integrase [Bacteroidales bacterium]|nr:tyrosine-type recombinase/integrase [Bacteroidales bacterium]
MDIFSIKLMKNRNFRALQPDEIRQDDTFRTRPELWLVNLVSRHNSGSKATICAQLTTEAKERVISPPAQTAGKPKTKTLESDRFMRIFCSFPEKVLGDSGTMTRRKTRTEIITLKKMVHHSTARHHSESGAELRYIRERLGHKSSKITEIYTHVTMKSLSNIKNPTDDFDI